MDPLVACSTCQQIHRIPANFQTKAKCSRCNAVLSIDRHGSLQRTAALALTALVLYVPANLLPVLKIKNLGRYSESTIWDGCVSLYQSGMWFVAIVVFLASIVIPLVKLVALFVLTAWAGSERVVQGRARLFRLVHFIGPWSMLDVFLVSILVALIKLDEVATVLPGQGLLFFAAVVVLTTMASASCDPRSLFPAKEKTDGV